MTDRELMQQALEALDSDNPYIQLRVAIALRARLEQPEQTDYVPMLDNEGRAMICNSHHYTPQNIKAFIGRLKRIEAPESGEVASDGDWRALAGIAWRLLAALYEDVPFAQPEQGPEPVAWRYKFGLTDTVVKICGDMTHMLKQCTIDRIGGGVKYGEVTWLYASPPPRPELSDELWTPCTTRLPPYGEDRRVLCYCAEHDYGGTQFITIKASDFYEYSPGHEDPGTDEARTVTHWAWEDEVIGAIERKVRG